MTNRLRTSADLAIRSWAEAFRYLVRGGDPDAIDWFVSTEYGNSRARFAAKQDSRAIGCP